MLVHQLVGFYLVAFAAISFSPSILFLTFFKLAYSCECSIKHLEDFAYEVFHKIDSKIYNLGTGNSSIRNLAFYQKVGFRFQSVLRDFFVEYYEEPIFENGIPCKDMVILDMDL